MKPYFPLFLSFENKSVIVIGGGVVAERKIIGLLPTGANISVVSPKVTDVIAELIKTKCVKWIKDIYQPKYAEKAFYIISATNDITVTHILKSTVRPDQLITYADDMEHSTAIVPAVVRRGGLIMAVSTSGASPTLARRIKAQLEETYSEDYEDYIDFLYEARRLIQLEIDDLFVRKNLLVEIVDHPQYKGENRVYLLQERIKQLLGQKE